MFSCFLSFRAITWQQDYLDSLNDEEYELRMNLMEDRYPINPGACITYECYNNVAKMLHECYTNGENCWKQCYTNALRVCEWQEYEGRMYLMKYRYPVNPVDIVVKKWNINFARMLYGKEMNARTHKCTHAQITLRADNSLLVTLNHHF
jgi:hypothetical protein